MKSKKPFHVIHDNVKLKHSVMKQLDLHIIQYCILDVIAREIEISSFIKTQKKELAKFICVKPNLFTHHFKELKKKNLIQYNQTSGFIFCDPDIQQLFSIYENRKGTYTLIYFPLISLWDITHTQYCILHTVFITEYRYKKYRKEDQVSQKSICKRLNVSINGLKKAIKILEQKDLFYCSPDRDYVLPDEIVEIFEEVHKMDFKK